MKRNRTAAALTLLSSGASAVLAQAEITAEQIGRLDAIVTPPLLSERAPGHHICPACLAFPLRG